MPLTLAKFSVEEYHRLVVMGAFAHRSVELLEGLIVEMAPEGPEHSDSIRESTDWLRANPRITAISPLRNIEQEQFSPYNSLN
jgi:Uma2 family endonuclease